MMKKNGEAIANEGATYFCKEYWKQDEGVRLYSFAKFKYSSQPRFSRKLLMDGIIVMTASIKKITIKT